MTKLTKKLTFKAKENKNNVSTLIIKIELRPTDSGIDELSICGEIKNKYGTIISGGQCLDEILKYSNDPLLMKLHTIWARWHLNCLRAGTKKQEDFLRELNGNPNYKQKCQLLKEAGLYDDNGIKYGHTWQKEELPEEVKEFIMNLCLNY